MSETANQVWICAGDGAMAASLGHSVPPPSAAPIHRFVVGTALASAPATNVQGSWSSGNDGLDTFSALCYGVAASLSRLDPRGVHVEMPKLCVHTRKHCTVHVI